MFDSNASLYARNGSPQPPAPHNPYSGYSKKEYSKMDLVWDLIRLMRVCDERAIDSKILLEKIDTIIASFDKEKNREDYEALIKIKESLNDKLVGHDDKDKDNLVSIFFSAHSELVDLTDLDLNDINMDEITKKVREEESSIGDYATESTYESVTAELTKWNKETSIIASSIEFNSKKIEFYEEKAKFQKYKEELELMSKRYEGQVQSFDISSKTMFDEIMRQISSLKMKSSSLEPLEFEKYNNEIMFQKLRSYNLECGYLIPEIKRDFESYINIHNSYSQKIDSIIAGSYEKYKTFTSKFYELLSIFKQSKKDDRNEEKELFKGIDREADEVYILYQEALTTKKINEALYFEARCNLLCSRYGKKIDDLLSSMLETKNNAKNEEKIPKTEYRKEEKIPIIEDRKQEQTPIIEDRQQKRQVEPKEEMLRLIWLYANYGTTSERIRKQFGLNPRKLSDEVESILVDLHSFIFNADPSNFGIEDVDKLEGLLSKMGFYSMYDTESKERIKNEIEAYKNEILERKGRSR